MDAIGRKSAPVQVVVYHPQSEEGRQALAGRVASVHADAVNRTIQKLGCPGRQKRQLLEAVIQAAKDEAAAQEL